MKNGFRRFLYALLIAVFISGNLFQGISAGPQADKAGPEVGTNPDTGKVSFIGGGAPIAIPGASGVQALSPQDKTMAAAQIYGPQFGLKNPSQELSLSKTTNDRNGHVITRYQQIYQGIPVLAGELIFNMNTNGDLLSASGEVSSNLSLDTHPAISGDAAGQAALGAMAKWHQVEASALTVSKPELMIFDESLLKASMRGPQLVWRVEVDARNGQLIREMVLVDAQTGAISLDINQIDTADAERVSISGQQSPKPAQNTFTAKTPSTASAPADVEAAGMGVALNSSKPSQNLNSGGTTWYVAGTGNDLNDCATTGTACATINGALGKATAGDTIKVASGTYTGSGDYVVTISKSIHILGGWDAAFTTQNGQSLLDGQGTRSVIYVHGTGLAVELSQITVQNSAGIAVYASNPNGTVNFNRVAIINNLGDGIYSFFGGNLNFTNSTISGNRSGHAIENLSGNVNIQYSTITNNIGYTDSAIYSINAAPVEIGNSILAENSAADCYGNITSDGHNIFGRSPACSTAVTTQPGDQVGTDPQLGPLTPGGYHALSASSPAIDAADLTTCPAIDQRGALRPYSAGCDIGAYEYIPTGSAATISAANGSGQAAALNRSLPVPLQVLVTDSDGAPFLGASVTFTAPASGAGGIFSDNGTHTTTVFTNSSGIATAATFTTNDIAGNYNITATTSGVADVASFSITNQDYYVSPSGSDGSDCLSAANACQTINGALARAPDGAGIRVAAGTYTGSGDYVVTISKSIQILGGWDAAFTAQNGQSIIDGQAARSGIYIHGTNLAVYLSQFMVKNGGGPSGVAVYDDNLGGSATFNRTALINNGGNGIYNNAGNVNFTNSTISGNHSVDALGSAISNVEGHINIQYSTIANNAGTYDYAIGSTNPGALVEIGNSILAGNTDGDCKANITSDGHNIFGRSPACSGAITLQPGDQAGVDPKIGPLTADGYHVLLVGSPAIDAGGPTCPADDERGVTRPQGSACDIGAFEYQSGMTPASVNVFQGYSQYIQLGTAAVPNFSAVVVDANGAGVPGITVTFTAPASGASGIFAGAGTNINTAVTGFNGVATASTFTTNSSLGAYSIQAAVSGLPSPAVFSIRNIPPVNILTYTMNHSANQNALPGTFVCNLTQPVCTSGPDVDVDHATQYAYDTYLFYQSHFQRNSIDGAGLPISASVHFDTNYANAFWNGSQMVYGDGFTADDVVGHELTHGVTDYTSQLIYAFQSGAINESLSDLFGEFIDQTDGAGNDSPAVKWLIGEDLPGGARRSMSNPPAYYQPDRMTSSYFSSAYWNDNGGVHRNSGVNNKAAFLMTDGGSFNDRTVTGIGLNKTAAIYYEVQTNLLGAGANYSDLYYAVHQACLNLIGGSDGITSADCAQVQIAIEAVEMNTKPSQTYTPNPDACAAGESVGSMLFSDDMESGTGNWSFGSIVGGNLWSLQTPGISSPTHSMVGLDPATVNDSAAAMTSDILVPSANTPVLYFKHYFEMDSWFDAYQNDLLEAYDGGVVEYSTDHGVSWNDAGPLFDAGQNYTGILSTFNSNPLGGRSAFSGPSNGMVASRYDLSSLKGLPVRFRWRVGTDNVIGQAGWYIDDVKVYTCGNVSQVTISGNTGIAGATLSYTDGTPKTATADGSGNYTLTVSNGFSGTVTPSMHGYKFSPGYRYFGATPVITDLINQDFTATPATYALTVTSPHGTVVRNPNTATYTYGEVVQLTVSPDPGWSFANWSVDATGTTNPVSITMSDDKFVIANYTQDIYSLTAATAHGFVTFTPPGPYHYGDRVQLKAYPDLGWNFVNWSGDASGTSNPVSITMNGNKSVTVNYGVREYTLAVISPHGTVTRDNPGPYHFGDVVQLTVSPDAEWTFTGWNGNASSTNNPLSVTMESDNTLTASYTQNAYTLTVTSAHGTVNRDNPGFYHYGDVVQLTAVPNAGWTFVNWTGDATGTTNPVSVTMDGNKSVTANYAQNVYTLTVTSAHGTVNRDNAGPYHYGDVVHLTAVPDTGWYFDNWSGDSPGISNPASIAISGNTTITANYAPITYTISGRLAVSRPVTLSYTDVTPKTVLSDSNGFYLLTVSYNWSGTVTPTETCYNFSPLARSYSHVTANQHNQDYFPAVVPGCANISASIAGSIWGSYIVQPNANIRSSYSGANNGPVQVTSENGKNIIASERVAYTPDGGTTWTNYSELMGLPSGQLTSSYVMPWYNNVDLNSQLRFGNVGSTATTVTVKVAGVVQGTYNLLPSQSARISYAGLNDGPVVVSSSGGVPIIASQRVAYYNGSAWTSFAELMGLPAGQLTTSYVMPWYNNVDLNSQLRFGNVGNAATTVTVKVAGVVQGTYNLAPSQSARISYAGLNNGPVEITSSAGVPIIASQRVAYYDGSVWTSFSELMGLPSGQLTNSYVMPVYDDVNLNTQLRFGNVGSTSTTVTVTVGGVLQGTYPLIPSQSARISYAGLNDGPVVVQSSGGVPIIVSDRVAYYNGSAWTSFSEMMGLPATQLTTSYVMPWYNNADLNTQLRFGVP